MTKIHHVLPADHLHATYLTEKEPYGYVLPLVHQALVTRREDEDDPASPVRSEIIGYVIDRYIVPADETSEGVKFVGYADRSQFTAEQWNEYIRNIINWGRQLAQQKQPVPETVKQVWEEPGQRPNTRRRRD